MLDPIIERVFDYKNLISKNISSYSKVCINFFARFNLVASLSLKIIKYKFDIRLQYYLLGKYLSKIDNQKYNFSNDKTLISMFQDIRMKKSKIADNDRALRDIFND